MPDMEDAGRFNGSETLLLPGAEATPGTLADADAYLCGPPPMVDAVRQYFKDAGTNPYSFHYEKFNPSQPKEEAA